MDKAIIKVSKELRLDQLKLDNAVVIIDESGEPYAGKISAKNQYKIEKPDIIALEEIHKEIHSRGSPSIIAIGGLTAINTAKILSLPRLPHKNLRETVYENKPPDLRPLIIATVPAMCTEATKLTLFFDPVNPVWLMRHTVSPVFLTTPAFLENALQDPKTQVVNHDVSLIKEAPDHNLSTYLSLCGLYEKFGPGPLTILLLTLVSLYPLNIEEVAKNLAKLNVQDAYSRIKIKDDPQSWIEEEAKLREKRPKLYKKMDLLVEHSWTFYSLQLRRYGFKGKTDLYKFYRSLLISLSILGKP